MGLPFGSWGSPAKRHCSLLCAKFPTVSLAIASRFDCWTWLTKHFLESSSWALFFTDSQVGLKTLLPGVTHLNVTPPHTHYFKMVQKIGSQTQMPRVWLKLAERCSLWADSWGFVWDEDRTHKRGFLLPHGYFALPVLPDCRAIHVITCLVYSWQSVIPLKKEIRFLLRVAIQSETTESDIVNLDIIVPVQLSFVF